MADPREDATTGATGPRKATAFQLVFMTYAVICSGAYGLEEIVSASGPGLALLALVVLPLVYAAPATLACAELSARFPVEGGYYRWVTMAFGDLVGYVAGWLVWISMFATNAAFAVLFGNYLRHFVPDLSPTAHFLVAVTLVWVAVALNYRGISLVGWTSVVFTILIFVPFFLLTVSGLWQWRFSPIQPFVHPEKTLLVAAFDGFLIAMWLYGGFEKLTVNAAEVENPRRAFPLALGIAVPMCALSYILPTLAALAANGDWQDWGESHYVASALAIGGPVLAAAMAAGGLVSNAGILMVTILGQSRLPVVLAQDGFFPPGFRRIHPRFGTPVVSLVVTGIVLTLLCRFRFAQLAGLYSLVQSLSYLLIYAALFRLRARATDSEGSSASPDGFRIPLGNLGLALLFLPSLALVTLVIRQGLWPDGKLATGQALLDLAIFTSGPVTYFLFRRWFGARRVMVAAGLALVFASAPGPAHAAEADEVRVGMDTRSRPWAYVPGLDYSKEDWLKAPVLQPAQIRQLEGVDIDLMNALARHMKATFVVVPHAWAAIEEGLLARRFDVILNAWAPSDLTPKGIVASPAYNEWGLLLAVRADQAGIQSYRDLAGKRVGHFKDRSVSRGVQSLATSILVGVEDSDELFDKLAAGALDAAVEDSTYVRWRVARDPRFRVVGDRLNRYGYHLGLRREDKALFARVEAAIRALAASGEVEKIRARWEKP
jgi:amino acid transporter